MRPHSTNTEIKYLLEFFSLEQREQWRRAPDEMPRIWVRAGAEFDYEERLTLRFLSVTLAANLNGNKISTNDETIEILSEIRSLLMCWIIETPNEQIFTKRSDDADDDFPPSDFDYIWRTLARLCRLAMEDPEIARIDAAGVTFGSLLEAYGIPLD